MGKLVVSEFMSLDGIIEDPGGAEGYAHGGWSFQNPTPDGDQFKLEELRAADVLLLGRVTYQGFAAAWPGMGGDDFGQRMNNIHKYLVSKTLADGDATWGPTTVLRGDVATEVAALKDQPGGNLLVEGSAQLVHTLAQHDLVDEYRLMVFPVILGQGKRLFPDTMPEPAKLTVADSRTVGSGVILLRLHPQVTG